MSYLGNWPMKPCQGDGCPNKLSASSPADLCPTCMKAHDDAERDQILDAATDPVEAWRLEQLIAAGWTVENAELLNLGCVDLHTACDLLQRGCPPSVALGILL